MTQPAITTSDPLDGATDVFTNIALDVTFNVALLESSVSSTSVLLQEVGTNELVSCAVSLVTTTKVRVTPIGSLAEDTLYKIKFPGTDVALSSAFVISDTGSEALTSTLTVQFRTGSRVYIDDTKVDKDATDLSLEGDLNLPIHVKALGDLAVSSTYPKRNTYDQAGITGVSITFNTELSSGYFSDSWVEVDAYPLLDSTTWLAVSGSFTGASIPSYTITHNLKTLYVNFSHALPQNAGVEITLDQDITDIDGGEYGPNDFLLSFTTDRYPSYSGIHEVKRELKAIAKELTNDYITATLFSNTAKYLCKYTGRTVEECLIRRWVLNKSIVDILDDKELEKAVVAGTRRHLGDFSVSVDPIIGKMALKHQRAADEVDKIERTIIHPMALSYSLENQIGIQRTYRQWPGVNGRIVSSRFVYWQPDIPAANLDINRAAKNSNPYFY